MNKQSVSYDKNLYEIVFLYETDSKYMNRGIKYLKMKIEKKKLSVLVKLKIRGS